MLHCKLIYLAKNQGTIVADPLECQELYEFFAAEIPIEYLFVFNSKSTMLYPGTDSSVSYSHEVIGKNTVFTAHSHPGDGLIAMEPSNLDYLDIHLRFQINGIIFSKFGVSIFDNILSYLPNVEIHKKHFAFLMNGGKSRSLVIESLEPIFIAARQEYRRAHSFNFPVKKWLWTDIQKDYPPTLKVYKLLEALTKQG